VIKRIYFTAIILGMFAMVSCGNASRKADEGFRFLEQKKEISALDAFNEALRDDPDHPRALLGISVLMSRNELTRPIALRNLRNAMPGLSREKDKNLACELLAEVMIAENQKEGAMKFLTDAFAKKTCFSEKSLFILSDLLRKSGQSKNAEKILKKKVRPEMKKIGILHALILAKDLYQYPAAVHILENMKLYELSQNTEAIRKKIFLNMLVYYKFGNIPKAQEGARLLEKIHPEEKVAYEKMLKNMQYGALTFTWPEFTWEEL